MAAGAYIFDAYGTLFDVHAAIAKYGDRIGENAARLSELWRSKQLEYTWTLSAMDRYEDFERLTERALDFALAKFPEADPALKPALLAAYRELDAFPDARAALQSLKAAGAVTGILSNGSPEMLDAAIGAAKLAPLLDHVISVDEIGIYKPRGEVYALVTEALELKPEDIAFVSSNRWDVAGAANFGFTAIWVNRGKVPDEYQNLAPAFIVPDLQSLPDLDL